MCSSSLNFSHALPQRLQASAQAVQMLSLNGPLRDTMLAAAEQWVAQSWQVRSVCRCSFLPSAISLAQCAAQESHSRWQSLHALAHLSNSLACSCSWSATAGVQAVRAAASARQAAKRIGRTVEPPRATGEVNGIAPENDVPGAVDSPASSRRLASVRRV